jgi:hypothetical protein
VAAAIAALAMVSMVGLSGVGLSEAQPKAKPAAAKGAKGVKGVKGAKGAKGAKGKPAPKVKVDVKVEAAALVAADVPRAAKAAELLGASKDPAALEHLLDALALGLDPKISEAALQSLAQFSSPRAFDVAAQYARHRNRRVRAAAVGVLGSINDERAVALVLAAMRDPHKDVREAAVTVVQLRKLKRGIEPMIALLKKGDEAPAAGLAAMADADLALSLGELIGVAPDAALARTLGLVLMRPDFKPEGARVQVVRTLGKIPGSESVEYLTSYMESIPEKPPRQSRREAEAIIEQRLTGDN